MSVLTPAAPGGASVDASVEAATDSAVFADLMLKEETQAAPPVVSVVPVAQASETTAPIEAAPVEPAKDDIAVAPAPPAWFAPPPPVQQTAAPTAPADPTAPTTEATPVVAAAPSPAPSAVSEAVEAAPIAPTTEPAVAATTTAATAAPVSAATPPCNHIRLPQGGAPRRLCRAGCGAGTSVNRERRAVGRAAAVAPWSGPSCTGRRPAGRDRLPIGRGRTPGLGARSDTGRSHSDRQRRSDSQPTRPGRCSHRCCRVSARRPPGRCAHLGRNACGYGRRRAPG